MESSTFSFQVYVYPFRLSCNLNEINQKKELCDLYIQIHLLSRQYEYRLFVAYFRRETLHY